MCVYIYIDYNYLYYNLTSSYDILFHSTSFFAPLRPSRDPGTRKNPCHGPSTRHDGMTSDPAGYPLAMTNSSPCQKDGPNRNLDASPSNLAAMVGFSMANWQCHSQMVLYS